MSDNYTKRNRKKAEHFLRIRRGMNMFENTEDAKTYWSCEGKRVAAHSERIGVQKAAEAEEKYGVKFAVYLCKNCKMYHLSSLKTRAQRRARRAEREKTLPIINF